MQAVHGMLAPTRTQALARELFWDQVTMYLESEARPALRRVYEDRVRPALTEALGRDPDRHEVARAMLGEDANRFWHSLRTQSQREGLEASRVVIVEQLDELTDRARARSNGPGSLTLDPDLLPHRDPGRRPDRRGALRPPDHARAHGLARLA